MTIQPYLTFGGRCQEAVDFYREALGAEVQMLMRFRDADKPPPGMVPTIGQRSCTVASRLATRCGVNGCAAAKNSRGFSLSLTAANRLRPIAVCCALHRAVTMPLGKTFFSPRFGMLVDRFGVSWMVTALTEANVPAAQAGNTKANRMAAARVLHRVGIRDASIPKYTCDILEDVVEIGFALRVALATSGRFRTTFRHLSRR